ncbi:peptidoglycan glycosyltransferase FtsI [Blochmannia endosymbiont of Polyrhachis (Hedomyrma) turneri]|uniref:peptidoglycan glycosyltransferase FtsI n=1 Tax=Blochmannia endosymbiont of Polyrhachis (Hedomyrma) turneri TaxID=1505596 RepID=UPI00061A753D|nr:peptidoglycan glycosyltransferase FtsI [Blochmannia endosymbiont of Polyrhachis (Hedomyrma) turneri]AKC59719.1 peptidoglycan synthase FtsI [Blochmannia endosymbiont of Polyrhachis (Hedomyrma) turneri]
MKLKYHKVYNDFSDFRFFSLYIFIFLLFVVLIVRIVYLQLINHDWLLREGDIRSLRNQRVDITRGMIRDRVGRLLAVSVPVYAVCANPKELIKDELLNMFVGSKWQVFSDVLSMPLNQISSRIRLRSNDNFVYLARQISSSTGEYILNLKLPGIYLSKESRRYYPCSQITAHIIGFTDIDGYGIEGVEKSFNSLLQGVPGQRIVRQDPSGKVIEHVSSVDRRLANNLFLSIDERLQNLVYRELNHAVIAHKAESGSAVLIDVNTGEVLAMVNSPSYNPNNLSVAAKRFIRNRAITDLFEPGSTIKPVVIIAALQQGIIQEDSVLNTLPYFINGYQIKDVVRYERLSIKDILQKSSNVGVSKLALNMPCSVLVDAYLQFGIGVKTNLGLVGEAYSSSFCKNHYSDIERATLSYGYGLMVTPLQLAKVYATIGSMGISRPISIVRIEKSTIVSGKQIFPASLVRTVLNMMNTVSLSIGNNVEDSYKYRIAIKTGTVKKINQSGKYVNKYIAYAAGVAPIYQPKFSLVVVINEPKSGQYYGGIVSAPVFEKIMKGVFRITDMTLNQKVSAGDVFDDNFFFESYRKS